MGQRAALAFEYVGEVIDKEIMEIHAALASPEAVKIEKLVMMLQALTFIKNKLINQKAVGEESAKTLQQEE